MATSNDELFLQITNMALSISENSYSAGIKKGHELLKELRYAGAQQDYVYKILFEKNNSLPDNLSRDFLADLLDYVCGWCLPKYRIWNN